MAIKKQLGEVDMAKLYEEYKESCLEDYLEELMRVK